MAILEVDTERSDELGRIALIGELDLSTVEKVDREIRRIEAEAPPIIALDLGRVTFLDSSGLRMIVSADNRARRDGRRFVVVRGPDTVQRVFTITNLEKQLEIVASLDDVSTSGDGD